MRKMCEVPTKQACVQPRTTVLYMALPAFAAAAGAVAAERRRLLSVDISSSKPVGGRCCCRSTGQMDGRTDGRSTVS